MLRKQKKLEDSLSEHIARAIKAGAKIEPGQLVAEMEAVGRWPDWKQAFIDRCGERAAEMVIACTPYTMRLKVSVADE